MNYVQRPIIALKSQLVIGDGNSDGSVFDSAGSVVCGCFLSIICIRTASRAMPRPCAVWQNGCQSGYPPERLCDLSGLCPAGPFVINDLNPATSSGDLQVTVEEKDGTQQQYIVPYSTLPVLQREGRVKYDVMAGNSAAVTATG